MSILKDEAKGKMDQIHNQNKNFTDTSINISFRLFPTRKFKIISILLLSTLKKLLIFRFQKPLWPTDWYDLFPLHTLW